MPSFKKKYKLFLWILDIREIYIKLFTNVIKLFTNYARIQMEEQRTAENREQISSSSGRTREHTCMITSYDGITGESAGQPALVHRPIGRLVS